MGAHLDICKTKKSNIVNNKLLIDESYKIIGEIDCSYSDMNNFCKDKNIVELVKREEWNDYFYHIADDEDIENIGDWIINVLDYDKENEIIIVVYDNA